MAAPDTAVNLDERLAVITDHWSPRTVGQINAMHVKAVKLEGEFVWHVHDNTDEFFIVPMGVEHRPPADAECEVLLLEPAGVVNTVNASISDHTAPSDDWI